MDDLISRQAAIDVFGDVHPLDYNAQTYLDKIKALPFAQSVARDINVLSNDLISRQAAIDAANDWLLDCFKVQKQDKSCGLIRRLEELPSAQPERKRGKWIDAVLPNDNGGLPVEVCDQCNTFYPMAFIGGGSKFCPNCGAKMEGDAE